MTKPARTVGCSPILRTAIRGSTRPPARTDGGVGGLLGGLDVERCDPTWDRTTRCRSLLLCCNQGGRVGSHRDCTWILGLPGFRVEQAEGDDAAADSRLRIRIERRGPRRYPCSGCGRRTSRVRSARDRTWDDLPWAAHPVTLVYRQRRVDCPRCGIRTERLEVAHPRARVTRRLRQQIGIGCQSMPTSHAAVRHGVSWSKARRAEKAFLAEWDRMRLKRQPRHIGLDEIQRGKGQRFWTVLSDVVHGEVIGLRQDRTEAAATALLTQELTGRQRAAITA